MADQLSNTAGGRFRVLSIALKVFAAFAILSGVYDILTGTAFLSGMGGQLGAAASDAALTVSSAFPAPHGSGIGFMIIEIAGPIAVLWSYRQLTR